MGVGGWVGERTITAFSEKKNAWENPSSRSFRSSRALSLSLFIPFSFLLVHSPLIMPSQLLAVSVRLATISLGVTPRQNQYGYGKRSVDYQNTEYSSFWCRAIIKSAVLQSWTCLQISHTCFFFSFFFPMKPKSTMTSSCV